MTSIEAEIEKIADSRDVKQIKKPLSSGGKFLIGLSGNL